MHRDEQPGLPDDVWQRFLQDSEAEIRRTAPREPSARERATTPTPAATTPALTAPEPSAPGADSAPSDAVGELWRPPTAPASAPWHDLDSRGRLRRAVRLLGAVAAITAALATASLLPNAPTPRADRPGIVLQESETAPTDQPTAEASPSPAVFTRPPG